MTEYKSQIWRVNVREQSLKQEPVPDTWKRLGGRGLLTRILLDEVDAKCDPLGAGNKLIFAPGLLVGHMLSSTDRISVGGKSPLTGGVKEANAGGFTINKQINFFCSFILFDNIFMFRIMFPGSDAHHFFEIKHIHFITDYNECLQLIFRKI